jgi:hypothetical protein
VTCLCLVCSLTARCRCCSAANTLCSDAPACPLSVAMRASSQPSASWSLQRCVRHPPSLRCLTLLPGPFPSHARPPQIPVLAHRRRLVGGPLVPRALRHAVRACKGHRRNRQSAAWSRGRAVSGCRGPAHPPHHAPLPRQPQRAFRHRAITLASHHVFMLPAASLSSASAHSPAD